MTNNERQADVSQEEQERPFRTEKMPGNMSGENTSKCCVQLDRFVLFMFQFTAARYSDHATVARSQSPLAALRGTYGKRASEPPKRLLKKFITTWGAIGSCGS